MTGKLKKSRSPDRDRADAARLQRAGTKGDTILAHINPQEAGLLDWLADQKIDATRNPKTGLLSFGENDSDDDGGISGGVGQDSFGGGYSGGGDISGGNTNGADRTFGWDGRSYYSGPLSAESIMNTPNGYRAEGYQGISMMQYSPPDTLGRLWDVFRYGPPPSYKALGAVPGRYGMPTGRGPGIAGTVAANFGGPMMSAVMGLGTKFDQAMSPATRAASLAENQALGSRNSSGNENARLGHTVDALGSPLPGGSGSSGGLLGDGTAVGAASTVAPGGVTTPTVAPGTVMDTTGRSGTNTLTGLPQPVQNLLADYLWRGRQGRGLNW